MLIELIYGKHVLIVCKHVLTAAKHVLIVIRQPYLHGEIGAALTCDSEDH